MTALRDWTEPARQPSGVRAAPERTAAPDRVQLVRGAERQRLASALHDEVSPLLFAMGGGVRQALELVAADPAAVRGVLIRLGEQLELAQQRLRDVIASRSPSDPLDSVPVATQRDIDDFTARTGIATQLVMRGRPERLAPPVERVALNCVRQALFNIERHAGARLVVITLDYRADRLLVVVQDDGLGLPAGFEPRAVPAEGHHWGFTSMAEQVERLGGAIELRQAEEGGTQLRLQLPRRSPAEAGETAAP